MVFSYWEEIYDHSSIAALAKFEEGEQQSKCCFARKSPQSVEDPGKMKKEHLRTEDNKMASFGAFELLDLHGNAMPAINCLQKEK